MTMKTCLIAAAALAAALATGCSSVLGFKDPSLNNVTPDDAATDAPIDAAAMAIDGAIDGAIDAPPTDTGPAACVPSACPFGCDTTTNMCRPAELWVFETTGLFVGNDFGGKDNTVRATSDALCFATATTKFMTRACNSARTHAILSVSSADSIGLMATTYGIPTAAPVHRADDDVVVIDTWDNLVGKQVSPNVPVTTAMSAAAGTVWTGLGETPQTTCNKWASAAATDFGEQGNTTITSTNWLFRGATECDFLAHLLCICWSGGQ